MFYTTEISGEIGLEKLKEICKSRIFLLHHLSILKSLTEIQSWVTENWNIVEDLIFNDGKDATSHNILLILSAINPEFRSLFVKGETTLFLYRLSLDFSYAQVLKSFQELFQYFSIKNTDSELLILIEKVIKNNLIRHYFDKHRKDELKLQTYQFKKDEDCETVNVEVSFQILPKLVASRIVVIKRGVINLACKHHVYLFKQIFSILLEKRLNSYIENNPYVIQVFNGEVNDQRTKSLFRYLQNYNSEIRNILYDKSPKASFSLLNIINIEKESEQFPSCMKAIYKKLIKGEKLGHNQRFNFSLFLKDAGMSMDQANRFWQKNYSNIKGIGKSSSLWEERKHKYSYSVKHLYGQAGSRRIYKTAHCSALFSQNICAFSNSDIEDLVPPSGVVKSDHSSKIKHEASTSTSQDNFSSQAAGSRQYLTCCARFEQQHKPFSSPLQLYKLKKVTDKL